MNENLMEAMRKIEIVRDKLPGYSNDRERLTKAMDDIKKSATTPPTAAGASAGTQTGEERACPCGLATCVESWEPGCGLGTREEFARRVTEDDATVRVPREPTLEDAIVVIRSLVNALRAMLIGNKCSPVKRRENRREAEAAVQFAMRYFAAAESGE